MVWKKSLLTLMIGLFVVTGLACLEVENETQKGSGDSMASSTPASMTPLAEEPTSMPTINGETVPNPTIEPTIPTASISEPMPTLTEPPVATDPPATPPPVPTKTISQCEKDELAVQAALDAYYLELEKWPTVDGLPGEIAWEEIVPTYMDEMPFANNKCEWRVNSDPEGSACMGRRC